MTFDPNSLVDPKFVGIPWERLGRKFEGVDCIGLSWLYLTAHGIPVPDADGMPIPRDWKKSDAERMIRETLRLGDLAPLNKLKKFDLIMFALSDNTRMPDHLGVMVSGSCFLHILENQDSKVTQIDAFWKSRMCGAVRLGKARSYLPEGAEVRIKI